MSKAFSNLPQLFPDAYYWLCKSRKKHPPDSDIWNQKRTWDSQAEAIMESFRSGTYQFDVQAKITLSCGETIAIWSSQDALIIKVSTGIIQEKLKLFLLKTCYNLKGNGGLKGAVRNVMKQLPKYKFFCKTDVSSETLSKAMAGEYNEMEIKRGLSLDLMAKYFTKDGTNWVINSSIRVMVEFRQINLIKPFTMLGGHDVVLCRNVLIYFDDDAKVRMLDQFYDILSDGGFAVPPLLVMTEMISPAIVLPHK